MKQIFILLILFTACYDVNALEWMTQYDAAVKEAKTKQLPLLLYFTETDCRWCAKLDNEALATPEFSEATKNRFIFVKVDFPSDNADQNAALQRRFNVRGFPTIILLDPDEQQIGITGYRPGGGKEFAQHLLQIVHDYAGYKGQLNTMDLQSDLKGLYEKAKTYQVPNDMNKIINKGIHSNESSYFILERLRRHSCLDQLSADESNSLREKLLSSNPGMETEFNLAVIDFERTNAIDPLVAYLTKYGTSDKDNHWRINTIISQVLYEQNLYAEALKYARQSLETAPSSKRSEIAEAIEEIKHKI